MNSDQLLSKQGPLAHVWLAANYDKKLSKQQLLSTNIITSSKYITNQPLTFRSASSQEESSQGTITLRLSGQLLLGIVRIYSRKTKYLLDDVNDTLFKLKNSFRVATGGSILGGDSANSKSVNLPAQQTVISNVNNLILSDQVAEFDLLYQEDLNLDDDDDMPPASANTLFSQVNNSVNHEDSFTFDQSIEYPRYNDDMNTQNDAGDVDLELDFDLDVDEDGDSDKSIELGRDAAAVNNDHPEMSLLDIKENEDASINFNNDDFNFDQPIETIDELDHHNENAASEPVTPPSEQPAPRVQRPRKATVGITEDGELRTNKRKLIVDSNEDLENGIPTDTLRSIQQLQLSDSYNDESITLNLSESEKLQLIQELSSPIASNTKRRKLWNLDDHLQQECLRLSKEEEEAKERENAEVSWDQNDFANDFDLSLPELDSDHGDEDILAALEEIPADVLDEESEDFGNDNTTKASIQVAGHLRDVLSETSVTELSKIIEKDLSITNESEQTYPLGIVSKSNDSIKISKRREATKNFFELLVLATHDCISIDQKIPSDSTEIGGKIDIRSKHQLFSKFL